MITGEIIERRSCKGPNAHTGMIYFYICPMFSKLKKWKLQLGKYKQNQPCILVNSSYFFFTCLFLLFKAIICDCVGLFNLLPPTNEKNPLFSIILVIIEYHYSSELFSYVFKLGFNLVLTWVSSSLFLDLIFKLRINLIWYQLGNVSTCNKNYTEVISYNEWRYPWSRIVIFFLMKVS